MMDDQALLRYSRHILLKEIGIEGQEAINQATVLVVGCGGLGSMVIPLLAAAGVGKLILADADQLELSNLQRQVTYANADIGQPKVLLARNAIQRLNPWVKVDVIHEYLDIDRLLFFTQQANVVIDCSDNYETRCAINSASVKTLTPLVSGAAARFDGQLAVYVPKEAASPCYYCLFGSQNTTTDGECATLGIFSPLVSIIGAQQASEALKLIIRIGSIPIGQLMIYDALSSRVSQFYFSRNPYCKICAHR
jgi:molybdopterin/thiamine biosynthesis adenylyltransferase